MLLPTQISLLRPFDFNLLEYCPVLFDYSYCFSFLHTSQTFEVWVPKLNTVLCTDNQVHVSQNYRVFLPNPKSSSNSFSELYNFQGHSEVLPVQCTPVIRIQTLSLRHSQRNALTSASSGLTDTHLCAELGSCSTNRLKYHPLKPLNKEAQILV